MQYMERVKTAMLTGGVGSRTSFSLTWDKMIIVLVLKGLSNNDQSELLRCFDSFDVSMENLTEFLLTLSAIASNSSNHSVNTITFKKKNSPGKAKHKEDNVTKEREKAL